MQKFTCFYHLVLEISLISKSCNLIGQEHFGTYLRNHIFMKCWICLRIQQIILTLIKEQIQQKIMTKFSNKFKKGYFCPFLVHCPHSVGKDITFKESGSVTHNTTWPLMSFSVPEKSSKSIPRKLLDGRTEDPNS